MWKDIVVRFNQSLSDPQYVRVLKEAQKYASGLHMSSNRYPVGETSVPSSDPQTHLGKGPPGIIPFPDCLVGLRGCNLRARSPQLRT